MTYRAKCARRREGGRNPLNYPSSQIARRAKVRRSRVDFDAGPYVCPGCHAFDEEPCLPDCIDDEMRREREEARLYGEYDAGWLDGEDGGTP